MFLLIFFYDLIFGEVLVVKNVLYDEYLLAGDVTNDNNIKMNDVMKISKYIVEGGSL